MLGKILIAVLIVGALLIIGLIAYAVMTSSGGYSAGPLADGAQYPLLCKKKQTAKPTSGKYTTTSDNKIHDVQANLQAALSKLHGNDTYTVSSQELLGLTAPSPGSLKFTYAC